MSALAHRACPVVLAAPSGTGKTTIARSLVESFEEFVFSVSATTRPARAEEVDGGDYQFVSESDFQAMVDADEFVEYATVHGHRYGTTRDAVQSASDAGQNLILDVDVQGALRIRERVPEAVLVFVFPPTADMLSERLRGRATESDELVMRRLKNAQGELEKAEVFDYIVVNDQVGRAVDEVRAILIAESRRTAQAIDLSTVIRQLQRRIDEILARDFNLGGE